MREVIKEIRVRQEDGTLSPILDIGAKAENIDFIDGKKLDVKINEKESIEYDLYNTYVNCRLITTLQPPAGYYAQSMCYDGSQYLYVFYTDKKILQGRKYDIKNNFKLIIDKRMSFPGHANSACYYKGRIYLANFDNNHQINIVDTNLNLIRNEDSGLAIRGFALEEDPLGNVFAAYLQYDTNQLREFNILDDKSMRCLWVDTTSLAVANRNAIKIINMGNIPYICYVKGSERPERNYKGNTVEFKKIGGHERFTVSLVNSGFEVQDIVKLNDNYDCYMINYAGEIRSFNIKLCVPLTYHLSTFLAGGNQTSVMLNKLAFTGTDNSTLQFRNIGNYKLCTKFITTFRNNQLLCNFKIDDRNYTVESNYVNEPNQTGNIPISYTTTKLIGSKYYLVTLKLSYHTLKEEKNSVINTNGIHSGYELDDNYEQNLIIYNLSDNKLEVDVKTIDEIVNKLSTTYNGLLKDIFPNYLIDLGFYTKTTNMKTTLLD